MMYIAYRDPHRTPVFPGLVHIHTRAAELAASRKLGKDWRTRGYLVKPYTEDQWNTPNR